MLSHTSCEALASELTLFHFLICKMGTCLYTTPFWGLSSNICKIHTHHLIQRKVSFTITESFLLLYFWSYLPDCEEMVLHSPECSVWNVRTLQSVWVTWETPAWRHGNVGWPVTVFITQQHSALLRAELLQQGCFYSLLLSYISPNRDVGKTSLLFLFLSTQDSSKLWWERCFQGWPKSSPLTFAFTWASPMDLSIFRGPYWSLFVNTPLQLLLLFLKLGFLKGLYLLSLMNIWSLKK